MKKFIKKYKYDLLMITVFLIPGLAGNMFFDDYVLQQEVNCSSATYVADNPFECKRVGE